ncbi:MAG: hypothetical protein AAGE94_14895 [Acidobacteriota bacterium]
MPRPDGNISMTRTFDIDQAANRLKELVSRAERGEEVILAHADRPVAKIVAVRNDDARTTRTFGRYRGQIEMAESFDDPLPEDFWNGSSD